MTHLVLMTFLNSPNDGLLDVMETTLLHMMILPDDSMLLLDDILHNVVGDANIAVLLLVDHSDAIPDVDLDPNMHDEMAHKAILLLNILHDDPILLMRYSQSILDEAIQKCCIQSDVEVHDDGHSMSTRSPLDSHSRCHIHYVMSTPLL